VLQSAVLGAKYDTISAEISGAAHERDAASRKTTMPSPHANANLRHVTGLRALRALEAAEAEASAAAASAAATPGPTGGVGTQVAAASSSGPSMPNTSAHTPSHSPSSASSSASGSGGGRPDGGTLRVSVQLRGLAAGFNPAQGILPEMRIAVGGANLHAPLVERVIELPMDIHAGQVGAGWGSAALSCNVLSL
jgi:hypothetical protein